MTGAFVGGKTAIDKDTREVVLPNYYCATDIFRHSLVLGLETLRSSQDNSS